MQDHVAEAFAGDAALFLVDGEAGIGKSRLVQELADRVRASGARVVVGCCLDFGEVGLPYAPVREALRDLAEQVEVDDGASATGPEPQALDQSHYFEQVLRVLVSAARSAPLLVVLEDLHWVDASTADLLTFLTRNLHRAPIALVGTFRTQSMRNHPALRRLVSDLYRRGAGRLDLRPLDGAQVKTLLASLTEKPVLAATVESVAQRTGGNPFFIEELVASGVAASPELPESLRDLLLSTLDPLPGRVQDVLHLLGVSGQQTRFELLERVAAEAGLAGSDQLEHLLDAAVSAGIVTSDSQRLRFRHDLLWEAVAGQVPPGRRRRWHRALALALEADPTLSGLGPAATAGQLAYHWDQAGEVDRCLVSSLAAARAAAAANAPAEAAAHFRRVLKLWPVVQSPGVLTGAEHSAVLTEAGTSLKHVGSYDEAARMYAQALAEVDITGDPTSRALARERLARIAWVKDDEDGALALCTEAATLVEAEPASVGKATAIAAHAEYLMLSDHCEEAIARSREAIQLAVAASDGSTQAAATITLGTALTNAGRLEEGIALILRGLAIARQIPDLDQIERAVLHLSWPLAQLRRSGTGNRSPAGRHRRRRRAGPSEHSRLPADPPRRYLIDAGDWTRPKPCCAILTPPSKVPTSSSSDCRNRARPGPRGHPDRGCPIEAALSESSRNSSPHTRMDVAVRGSRCGPGW